MGNAKRLRIAILGASHWHLPCYLGPATQEGHEVTLSDANAVRLAELVQKHNSKHPETHIAGAGDPAKLLDSRPDYAILLGQPEETASFIALCIERGVPFMAEKPGALRAETLTALAKRCQERNLFNAGPFCMRWDMAAIKVKEMMDQGRLGRIGRVSAGYFSGPANRYAKWGCPWAMDIKISGGGSLYNVGVHLIDLLRFWGMTPRYLSGRASYNLNRNDVDDVASMLLDVGNGGYAVLESGYLVQNPYGGLSFSIFAEKANVEYRDKALTVVWENGEKERHENPAAEPRDRMQADLIARALQGQPAPDTLYDMAEALRICNEFSEQLKGH